MSAPVFWVAELSGDQAVLTGPEGHHAGRVMRLRVGEDVVVTDGVGGHGVGVVAAVDGGTVRVALTRVKRAVRRVPRLVVVQAIPKGDRGELAVELMTELGVDEIVPWAAERNVTRWRGDRGEKALAKWRAAAFAAAKQARRVWFPTVTPQLSTRQVCRRITSGLAFVLHESATVPLGGQHVVDAPEVVLVVGPEGGITDTELASFVEAQARSVRLGAEVLRTSTAGAAALATLNVMTGAWR